MAGCRRGEVLSVRAPARPGGANLSPQSHTWVAQVARRRQPVAAVQLAARGARSFSTSRLSHPGSTIPGKRPRPVQRRAGHQLAISVIAAAHHHSGRPLMDEELVACRRPLSASFQPQTGIQDRKVLAVGLAGPVLPLAKLPVRQVAVDFARHPSYNLTARATCRSRQTRSASHAG